MSDATIDFDGADRLLNASEAAALLNVPESWIREQTRRGLVPHVRLGRYVRYRRVAVVEWLEPQELGQSSTLRRATRG
jgi:excisionase family DNA binding protein